MSAVLRGQPEDVVSQFDAADTGAPLLLITGMPGAGKTNYMLHEFALGKRDVWQANIPGCKIPEFDPKTWPEHLDEYPVDSTFLVDEGREVFPPVSPTSPPPAWYVLNRIRHTGRRFVIACQHPSDIDARVRRLCSRHLHFVEAFGGGAAQVYEWRGRIGDVDSSSKENDALRWKYGHDKAVFKLYKSTELHRGVKKKPWKVRAIPYIFASIPVLLILAFWWIWHRSQHLYEDINHVPPLAGATGTGSRIARGLEQDAARSLTTTEYLAKFDPRIKGLDFTAPAYDKATEVVVAPYPAACVVMHSKGCRCFSQQGTRLSVPADICEAIVRDGFFIAWKQEPPPPPLPPSYQASAATVPALAGSFSVPPPLPVASEPQTASTSARGLALPKPS